MLKVLCLILLMTYRRFVLSALVLLILQFIVSPTFNYSQTAAGFFSETCTLETSALKIIKCSVMYHLVCMWTFTLCLMPVTKQTCIMCPAPSKNEREAPFSLCFGNNVLSLLVFSVSNTIAGFLQLPLCVFFIIGFLCLLSEICYIGYQNLLVFLMVPDSTLCVELT